MENLVSLKATLADSKNIVITSHTSPDGDSVGSSLAMYYLLNKIDSKKNVTVILPDEAPTYLRWIPGSNDIITYDKEEEIAVEKIEKADLFFILDYNSYKRLGKEMGSFLEKKAKDKKTILIDHHQGNDIVSSYKFLDVLASSTSEMVFTFIERIEAYSYMDKNVALPLYIGILSDTQKFTVSNVSSKTHKIVSNLISFGLDVTQIQENLNARTTIEQIHLLGYILSEKLLFFKEARAAYIVFSLEEAKRFNFKKGDLEGVANLPLKVKDIRFSCLITEKEDQVNLSFRSTGNLKVNEIAKEYFNGGGHNNAAGAKSNLSLSEVENKIKKIIDSLILGYD